LPSCARLSLKPATFGLSSPEDTLSLGEVDIRLPELGDDLPGRLAMIPPFLPV
jgi:hypothetical protein